VTKQILKKGEVEKIACPVRLYTAETDGSVLPEPQEQFISRVRQGNRVFVKNARHEIYRSEDGVLFPWWHDVLSFLKDE
jgi:lysophospholipase